jgi:hypothetical protein
VIDGDREGNFRRIEYALTDAEAKGAEIAIFRSLRFWDGKNPDAHRMANPIPGADSDRVFGLPALNSVLIAQPAAPAKKRLLIIGEEKGYRHEAVSHAMSTIERLGRQSGLWDTVIRADTECLTKKKLEYYAGNLNDFDAVLFYTGGTLEMDDQHKKDFLSFVHDDGKGFIGIHTETIVPGLPHATAARIRPKQIRSILHSS